MIAHENVSETIMAWIGRAVADRFANVRIAADTALIEGGLIDSIEILNLVTFLEERFGVAIAAAEFVPENFRTPADVAALVIRLKRGV